MCLDKISSDPNSLALKNLESSFFLFLLGLWNCIADIVLISFELFLRWLLFFLHIHEVGEGGVVRVFDCFELAVGIETEHRSHQIKSQANAGSCKIKQIFAVEFIHVLAPLDTAQEITYISRMYTKKITAKNIDINV